MSAHMTGTEHPSAYDRLTDRFTRIATISEAASVLGWDAAAMMPPGGGAARGDQLAVLAGVAHAMLTAPEAADDLGAAESADDRATPEAADDLAAGASACADPDLLRWRAANLRLMRHAFTRASAVVKCHLTPT